MFILKQFDDHKPYYHYVFQYLINFYGFTMLLNKALLKRLSSFEKELKLSDKWSEYIDKMDLHEEEKEYLKKETLVYPKLLFPSNLVNSFNKDTVLINDENIVPLTDFNNADKKINALSNMSNMLIVMAFESLPAVIRYDKSDSFSNFFYHCRNGAAHGGIFNITNQTRFPAEWRGMKLNINHNNTNIVIDTSGNGLLKPMDIILLLLDAEKKYYDFL